MGPAELAGVLDAIGDGIYVVDRERRIRFWNSGAERLTGYPADEAVGRWCGDGMLDHIDDDGASVCGSRCPLLETMRDGRRRECRVHLHHQDGSMVPVRVAASPLYDATGEITGAVEVFVDDSARVQTARAVAALTERTLLDPLTGLGNRALLDRVLAGRVDAHNAGGPPFGLLFIDVDRFKCVNDTHGHQVGDRVLQVLSRTFTQGRRSDDVVVRYGGEEFVVVTGSIDTEGLITLADRLRMLAAQSRVPVADGVVRVNVSVGAALARFGDTAEVLLGRADARLLQAKRAGRDRTVGPGSRPCRDGDGARDHAPHPGVRNADLAGRGTR